MLDNSALGKAYPGLLADVCSVRRLERFFE
jgi:hypothetical protein